MLSAVYAVVVCLSVCVCVSVTLRYCIKTAKRRIFGLTTVDVRRLAFELATKMKLPHKFNKDSTTAGVDRLKGFM